MPFVAIHMTWDEIRLSSHMSIRIHVARGGHLDAEQLLDGQREHQLVVQRRQVVHARDVRRALDVGELLARLLHAGVQVADDRLERSTVSPSSSSMMRSTPWVEGCCGPRLMIIVSSSPNSTSIVDRGRARRLGQAQHCPVAISELAGLGLDRGCELLASRSRSASRELGDASAASSASVRLVLVAHRGPGASLNCTGTRPTP